MSRAQRAATALNDLHATKEKQEPQKLGGSQIVAIVAIMRNMMSLFHPKNGEESVKGFPHADSAQVVASLFLKS